jgi:soluble lytic murein transglycosylase
MIATAERNMDDEYPSAAALAWFQKYPPVTSVGLIKFLKASQGNQKAQREMIAKTWPSLRMDRNDQDILLRTYGALISKDTHRRRLDHLLFNENFQAAQNLATRLGQGYPQLVTARIALAQEAGNVEALMARIPPTLQNDPGLLYERLRWRRKKDLDVGALEILNAQPPRAQITNMEDWWRERNILVRRLIEEKKYREAYRIASDHDAMEGQEYADAEWLSGWLALRFLNKPQDAAAHFEAMYKRVRSAISRSRGAYWSGRAYEALGDSSRALDWYKIAASFPKTYYGQYAARELKSYMPAPEPAAATTTPADQTRIENSDLGRAIRIYHQAGFENLRAVLIRAYSEQMKSGADYKAFANMLNKMGLRFEALKLAKRAAGDNFYLPQEAYPRVPQLFTGLKIDVALAHALIRQESQFEEKARSPAGALGLMQLMPRTAKEVARKRGWAHRTDWLTSRPEHNVLLGSAFLNDLLARYDGAVPMALAAYNAGPSRVTKWIEQFGDPRTGQIDWIDWIELIPIYETRNYVQRVTENYNVYKNFRGLNR